MRIHRPLTASPCATSHGYKLNAAPAARLASTAHLAEDKVSSGDLPLLQQPCHDQQPGKSSQPRHNGGLSSAKQGSCSSCGPTHGGHTPGRRPTLKVPHRPKEFHDALSHAHSNERQRKRSSKQRLSLQPARHLLRALFVGRQGFNIVAHGQAHELKSVGAATFALRRCRRRVRRVEEAPAAIAPLACLGCFVAPWR